MRRGAVSAATALAAFSVAALAAGLGRGVLTTYLPVALDRIRDAPGLIGTVMLVNVASGFAVPLWVGLWSDRLRSRGHGRTMPFILGGALVTAGGWSPSRSAPARRTCSSRCAPRSPIRA